MTIKVKKLSVEDRAEAYAAFQEAVDSLTATWDALRDLEEYLGVEVETDAISEMAGDDDTSEEAFDRLLEELAK